MKKKLLSSLLIGAMVLSIVGCGGTGDSEKATQSHNNVSEYETENDVTQSDEKEDTSNKEVSMETLENTEETSKSAFDYHETDLGIMIDYYKGNDVVVVIPDEIDGIPVVALNDKAFINNFSVLAVKIADTVTDCGGDSIFLNCQKLKYVIFGKNVEIIGDNCFVGCLELEEVKISDKLQTIGEMSFSTGSDTLKELSVPESVIEIGDGAFWCTTIVYVKEGSYAEEYMAEYSKTMGNMEYVVE